MNRSRLMVRFCLLFSLIVVAGTLLVSRGSPVWYSFFSHEKDLPEETRVSMNALVSDKIQRQDGLILVLKTDNVMSRGRSYGPACCYLYEDGDDNLIRIGDHIQAEGKLSYFDHAHNPGNFDLYFYYGVRGIDFKLRPDKAELTETASLHFRETLYTAGVKADSDIRQVLGDDYGGLLSSVMLGRRSMLDPGIREMYQKNGIAHLLAISGLHVSLLAEALRKLLERTGIRKSVQHTIIAFALIIYLQICGAQVALIRAVIMSCLRMLAHSLGKAYDGFTSLTVSAALILLHEPFYIWDASFQLSFGAVGAIYGLMPYLRMRKLSLSSARRSRRISKTMDALVQSMLITGSVSAAGLPFILRHFYEFAPYAMLLNLFVIPLLSLVLAGGAAGMILTACIPGIGSKLALPAFYLARGSLQINSILCTLNEKLPFHRVVTGSPPMIVLTAYIIVIVRSAVNLRRYSTEQAYKLSADQFDGRGLMKYQIVRVFLMMFAAFLLMAGSRKMLNACSRATTIVMLDIGQGDCIYIDGGRGNRCLIDGGSSDVEEVARYRLEPFLLSQGVSEIDKVFVTHGDSDHINGIEQIIERKGRGVRIRNLIKTESFYDDEHLRELKQLAAANGIKVYDMSSSDQIKLGDGVMSCLWPPSMNTDALVPDAGNDASLVLSYTKGDFSMLFTGDIGEGVEEELIKEHTDMDSYDVLKVAHHGSKNSSDNDLLAAVKPTVSLISAGKKNMYGHPHAQTLKRLKRAGSKVYCTKWSGAICLKIEDDQIFITPFHIYKNNSHSVW